MNRMNEKKKKNKTTMRQWRSGWQWRHNDMKVEGWGNCDGDGDGEKLQEEMEKQQI